MESVGLKVLGYKRDSHLRGRLLGIQVWV